MNIKLVKWFHNSLTIKEMQENAIDKIIAENGL